ncbi:MAG TPA: hypothetical protein VLE43_00550 [Candidatus Saccharimonadia bacterium]|nr:hypothetical protein [Candidatus Saccharimonadia bacterium]
MIKKHPSPVQVFDENRPRTSSRMGSRHAFLTFWLLFMLVANVAGLMAVPRTIMVYQNAGVPNSATLLSVQGWCMGFNILFTLAIFRWWKWGFYGFIPSTLVSLGINLYFGLQAEHTLLGFMGVFVLFWALRLDDTDSAWKRMR